MDIKINAQFTPVDQATEEKKWLELRTTGIGGSDAGAILGMNEYTSALNVYFAKKNINGFEGNASTEWGHILEDPIRQMTAKELGIEIVTVPGMYTSYDYPFMNANLDGVCYVPAAKIIEGKEIQGFGGHEIKTSAKGDGFGDGEIPDSYYCQVQHYMAVTDLPWFILTVFILSSKKAQHYVILRSDEFIYTTLIPAERDFWENNVLANVPPAPKGVESEKDYLKNLPINAEITLDDETNQLVEEQQQLDEEIKKLKQKLDQIKNQIVVNLYKLSSDDSKKIDKVTAIGDKYKLTYNTQRKKMVDTDLLKKSGLFEEYSKESVSKVLRISKK